MNPNQPYDGAIDRGLQDVLACSSSISAIDGSRLVYRGHSIEDLAQQTTFEEVIHLLWFAELPSTQQLSAFQSQLRSEIALPKEIVEWLKTIPRRSALMDVIAASIAILSLADAEADRTDRATVMRQSIRLTARIGSIVGAYHRTRLGLPLLQPDSGHSLAWNLLRGITGDVPSREDERALDICLVLHADHELNASTFSARVTASTLSGVYSPIQSAIGTLKGPLHGGANTAVMSMLREIGTLAQTDGYIDGAFKRGEKVMGFGHRVYKDGDPRAEVLRKMSARLTAASGSAELFRISARIEDLMSARKSQLIPNVDFYSATVYDALRIPADLFTGVFAASRIAGWCAHVMEQYENNRIYRPRARYVGERKVRPLVERARRSSIQSSNHRR